MLYNETLIRVHVRMNPNFPKLVYIEYELLLRDGFRLS